MSRKKKKTEAKARICACGRITLRPDVCAKCAAERVASAAIAQAAR